MRINCFNGISSINIIKITKCYFSPINGISNINIQKTAQNIYVTMDDFKQAKNKIIPSAGREVMSYHSDVKWEDVIGVDEVKLELEKKVIRPWENKEKYEGLKMIKGILFYGPPGVGKTYLSRALGSKPGMNVISLKGSDILSKYQGDSPVKLRSFF